MHFVAIDEVIIVLAASKVQVRGSELGAAISLCFFALLHESYEGHNPSARTYHDDWNVIGLRHNKIRVSHKGHRGIGNLSFATRSQILVQNLLEVARYKPVSHYLLAALRESHLESRERNGNHQLLGMRQARRCNRVVAWLDQVTLLEDEIGSESEGWNDLQDVQET